MATTVAGDTLSDVYQIITEGLADVYQKRAALIMLETLNPQDIDGSTPEFLARMILEATSMAASYAAVSTNFMNAFLEAEEGNGTLNKAGVSVVAGKFDQIAFTKRMIATVNYGYKRRLSKAGVPMRSLPQKNEYFMAAVKEASTEATQRILSPGRQVTTETVKANPAVFYGYGRRANGSACDFCMMLTGRKNYISEESADFRAHANCKCTGFPITAPDWEPSPEALKGYEEFLDRQAKLDAKYGKENRRAGRRISKEQRDLAEGKISKEELDVREKERWVKKTKAATEKARAEGKIDDARYENIQKSFKQKEADNAATRQKIRADKDFAEGKISDEERANLKEKADVRAAQKKAALKPKGANGEISKSAAKKAILGG